MTSIEALRQHSARSGELVLPFSLALDALTALEAEGIEVHAWEGLLLHPDGRLGHSAQHQGTAGTGWDRSTLERTMREAQSAREKQPEVAGSELLFAIAAGA